VRVSKTTVLLPRKVKDRRELLNLECSIKYDSKGASLPGVGKARLTQSRFLALSALCGFRAFGLLRIFGL
jgi:hypothetical protein